MTVKTLLVIGLLLVKTAAFGKDSLLDLKDQFPSRNFSKKNGQKSSQVGSE